MTHAPAQVINGGRVTIPADIRQELGLEEGDYVIIDIEPWQGETYDRDY